MPHTILKKHQIVKWSSISAGMPLCLFFPFACSYSVPGVPDVTMADKNNLVLYYPPYVSTKITK